MTTRKIVKSVKFHLLPITAAKHERLEQISENFREIYNVAAARLPSLQNTSKFRSRNALNRLRIELHDITRVKSQVAQEAIEYARANYEAMTTRKDHIRATIKGLEEGIEEIGNNPRRKRTLMILERKLRRNRRTLRTRYPTLRRHIIRIHNQSWQFDVQKDRIYVVVPGERVGNRYNKIWLPMKESAHYRYLVNTVPKWGVGQLDLDTGVFITSMTTTIDVKDYTPKTFIGVDVSGENLTTLVTLKNGKVQQVRMWDGHEIDHVRSRFRDYRRRMQQLGRLDLVKKSRGREQRWMNYTNHVTSRRIAEIAVKQHNPFVAFEELRKPADGLRWNSAQLRQMADYKLAAHGIRRITLHSSKNYRSDNICSECEHNERKNRTGATFKCQKCGYSVHTGINTAKNIAKRSEYVLTKAAENKETKKKESEKS